jgi:hypothetical protein
MADTPDDSVDISGMPTPEEMGVGGASDADVAAMPSPADMFKRHVGRAPQGDYELKQFLARPEDFGAAPSTNTALGAAEIGATTVAGIPYEAARGAADIYRRVTGGDTNAPDNALVSGLNPTNYIPNATGQKLASDIKASLPRTKNGLDISDEELRQTMDPEGKIPIEKLRAAYKAASDKSIAQLLSESGTVKGDVVGGALNVGEDVNNLVQGGVLAKLGMSGVSRLASGARTVGTIKDFGGAKAAAAGELSIPAPTQPTPAVSGPITGADLRAQPDPLANAAASGASADLGTPATNVPPEASAAPTSSPRVPVPGKPHIRLKAQPEAAPVNEPTPANAPVNEPTPANAPVNAPTGGFEAPSAEGAVAGPRPADEQASRLATVQDLNRLAGGQLKEVRQSALSGDTAETGADYNHAKVNDAGGARMNGVIAGETNALRSGADNLVERTGSLEDGVDQPALRRRGTVISNAISGIEDWFDNNIKSLYTAAKERARGIPIQNMQRTSALLGDESEFAGTTEGEALYRGVQSRARKLGLIGADGVFKPSTIEQAEQFRQYLGERWTPQTSQLIGKLKDALDGDVAAHGGADLFQQARQLRAQKGAMLEDPTGIAKLLSPSDRLGVNRSVPLEQVPDYVANLPTDQFNHVINVLKSSAHLGNGELAEGAASALREIKGHMAAKLRDAGGSKIQGGWDAKSFYKQLNDYSNKMPSVFGPDEMRDWRTMNKASNVLRMDRSYPGAAAQLHNTGLINNIREKAGLAARGGVHAAAHHVIPGVGGVAAEMMGLGERAEKLVSGNPEARRLAMIEKRITPVEQSGTGGPTLGQTIGGARQRGGPKWTPTNNASGESSASLEAQNRVAQEQAAGQHRYQIDPDGNVTPLRGVDSVDARAPQGHIIVQRGVGATPYSVLDRGGLPQGAANGLLARAQGLGNLAEAERAQQPLGARIYGGKQRGAVGNLNAKEETPATVNVGLKIGDKASLTPAQVEKVLKAQGVKIVKRTVHDSNTEPTVVATLNKALTPKQANTVSALLKQDAIAQYTGGKGEIYGPKAEAWKPFNPDYFLDHEGKPLSAPLKGAPASDKPNLMARASAANYAKSAGIEHEPLTDYRYIPKETAQKVAQAYEEMQHNPTDPKVKASYDAFKKETKAQWNAIKDTGLKVDFKQPYPYGANPREVTEDVRNNNHMTVFPTEEGFGTNVEADKAHPMLEKSGETIDGKEVTYNDLFRIVHDYYGHVQEGNGFRGQGEYNAWRNHRTLYSKAAQPAMDSETLGQNAWVNNGPHAQANAGASQANTVYAEQKAGLLPKDVVKEASQGVSSEAHTATSHLTDEERAQLRSDTSQKLVDAFHKDLPPHEEYAAAALAGKVKKGWYADSAKAIANVFGPDAPRFAALLASMSPQTSVEMNFHNALRTFINWDKAGRPTDPKVIRGIMEDSSLKNPKTVGSNVLPAWVGNSVRALTSDNPETLALSGPKVHSFMRNLQNNVHEVTNDAWMAAFSKVDPAAIGGKGGVPGNKRPVYMAMSAKVRAAAKTLTHLTGESWTPREVQETVWSWAKTAYEHADSFGGLATIPELVKDGELTDELIKSTPDFHQLFSAPEHRGFIAGSRYAGNAQQLASGKVEGADTTGPSQKSAAAEKALRPFLESAAKRLESVRQERSRATSDEE